VQKPAFASPRGWIGATFAFTLSEFENILAQSQYLGIAFYNPNGPVNFVSTTMTLDREKLDRFARYCLAPRNADFTLTNHSDQESFVKLYYRRHGAPNFVGNRVNYDYTDIDLRSLLAPRHQVKISMPRHSGCSFDLRGFFADKTEIGWDNVDLCYMGSLGALYPLAGRPASDTLTKVHNIGKVAITGLNISSHNETSWGSNLIARGNNIAPGGSAAFPLAQYGTCHLDIRVVYANQTEEDRLNNDLCRWEPNFEAAPPAP
jgi:hypothetical protein